jgi:hypothetical protein
MSLAEDFQPRGILPGSTDQNPVAQGNVERRLAIIPDMAIQDPDPFENLEKLLDFPAQKRYSLELSSSTSSTLTYISAAPPHNVEIMSKPRQKMVAVDDVTRAGTFVVSSISVMSLLATWLSGAIIIQPIFAGLLILLSIGFYAITLVKE